jgi:hypothetical protein
VAALEGALEGAGEAGAGVDGPEAGADGVDADGPSLDARAAARCMNLRFSVPVESTMLWMTMRSAAREV